MYYAAKAITQDRTESGQFAPKSETPRHVRSIRLTDETTRPFAKAIFYDMAAVLIS